MWFFIITASVAAGYFLGIYMAKERVAKHLSGNDIFVKRPE